MFTSGIYQTVDLLNSMLTILNTASVEVSRLDFVFLHSGVQLSLFKQLLTKLNLRNFVSGVENQSFDSLFSS